MDESKVSITFKRKLRFLDSKDSDTREIAEYVRYMVEQLELKIRTLERRIKELESV